MQNNRRNFLKTATALGSGLFLTSFATKITGCTAAKGSAGANTKPFGLQLYTLREDFPKDPKGVLKQVADFGYKQVEGYEGNQGIFWGMKNTEMKSYLDGIGLTMVSTHCDMNRNFEQKADEAAAIGMKYLICPYLGANKSLDFYKKAADRFNQCGDICKQRGLKFAYHNHDYSFRPVEGQLPQDVMMQMANPSTVDFEMDIYWVVMAGQDPMAWMKKYPNRFTLCHVKDRGAVSGSNDKFESVVLGKGSIPYQRMLLEMEKSGMQYYIVEQEAYAGTTPLNAAKLNADYMQTVKL
ncbi:sugar phosphate isomerase/epimerase family protein [Pseudocnuella soli]|uniref:sugar phosphate isomerase/epimerase family protein n=1 Tax=Pseudocnuella soli TaxID=2502779 RepID=UPI0010537C53|nr:sugar phosphate isomerase/epimerase [Pseudocnuella soli]